MQQLDVEEVAEEMLEVDAEMVAVLAVEVAAAEAAAAEAVAAVVVNFISHLKVHRSHYLIIDQKRTIIL